MKKLLTINWHYMITFPKNFNPKHILLIRFGHLGDIILTEPVSRALQNKYPDSIIYFACKSQYVPIISHFKAIKKVLPLESNIKGFWKLLKEINKQKFDLIIDLQCKFNSLLLTFLAKSKYKITYKKRHLERHKIVKNKDKNIPIVHTLDLYLDTLKKLDINITSKELPSHLEIPSSAIQSALSAFQNHFNKKKIYIGLNPSATRFTKRWQIEYWLKLIELLLMEKKYQIIIFDKDNIAFWENHFEKNGENRENKEILLLNLPLNLLAAHISQCDLFITNDSGPMHIASAVDCPVIAIFGGTSTQLGFAPLIENAIILEKDLACRPCSLHGLNKCPEGHFKCMRDITPEEVKEAIVKNITTH